MKRVRLENHPNSLMFKKITKKFLASVKEDRIIRRVHNNRTKKSSQLDGDLGEKLRYKSHLSNLSWKKGLNC